MDNVIDAGDTISSKTSSAIYSVELSMIQLSKKDSYDDFDSCTENSLYKIIICIGQRSPRLLFSLYEIPRRSCSQGHTHDL